MADIGAQNISTTKHRDHLRFSGKGIDGANQSMPGATCEVDQRFLDTFFDVVEELVTVSESVFVPVPAAFVARRLIA